MRALALILLAALLASCNQTLHPSDQLMIDTRMEMVYAMSEIPRRQPELYYNRSRGWPIAAESNCHAWSVTMNYRLAANRPQFVINKVVPHEVAHIASCYHRGSTDGGTGNPHDDWWKQWVIRLGGDPEYI